MPSSAIRLPSSDNGNRSDNVWNLFFFWPASEKLGVKKKLWRKTAGRVLRIDSLAGYIGIFDDFAVALRYFGHRCGKEFTLCPHLFQRFWTVRTDCLLAAIGHLSSQFGGFGRLLHATSWFYVRPSGHGESQVYNHNILLKKLEKEKRAKLCHSLRKWFLMPFWVCEARRIRSVRKI